MIDHGTNGRDAVNRQSTFELLARETDTPVQLVQEMYDVEYAKLEQTARIKTFVSVLTHRRVKSILQKQRTATA